VAAVTFAWPFALLALAIIPIVLAGYVLVQRRRIRYAARFTNLDLLANVVDRTPGRRRHLPVALTLLALTALVVGIARPQIAVAVPREEATVVLAMDSSASMTATDVAPDRMSAARDAAARFVEGLPAAFRVGVVTFSDQADVAAPPTHDRNEVLQALASMRADSGTALGDAIVRALDLGQSSFATDPSTRGSEPPLIVLALSDGANTTGEYEPLEAAARAAEAGVPVYTVALGTPTGTIQQSDGYGVTRTIEVPPDPETMAAVAETTGGEFFDAPNEDDLRGVYDEIGSQLGTVEEQREVTVAFTGAGAVLLLAGAILSALWFHRIP
jgi:Ca-activated chloride channel family protein